jgi:hypothetical protein
MPIGDLMHCNLEIFIEGFSHGQLFKCPLINKIKGLVLPRACTNESYQVRIIKEALCITVLTHISDTRDLMILLLSHQHNHCLKQLGTRSILKKKTRISMIYTMTSYRFIIKKSIKVKNLLTREKKQIFILLLNSVLI